MTDLRRWGGWAGLASAACYVFAFVWALAVLVPAGYETGDFAPSEAVAFIADNQATMFIWTLVIYLIAGAALVVLALALHDRLKATARALAQVATAFGLVWATLVIGAGMLIVVDQTAIADLYGTDPQAAETVWVTLNAVEEGLGGGIELPGGLWLLVTSWAALTAGAFPRTLNYLGLVIGVVGVLTVVPVMADPLTSLFGIGLIGWFAWVGITLLRSHTVEQLSDSEAAEGRIEAPMRVG